MERRKHEMECLGLRRRARPQNTAASAMETRRSYVQQVMWNYNLPYARARSRLSYFSLRRERVHSENKDWRYMRVTRASLGFALWGIRQNVLLSYARREIILRQCDNLIPARISRGNSGKLTVVVHSWFSIKYLLDQQCFYVKLGRPVAMLSNVTRGKCDTLRVSWASTCLNFRLPTLSEEISLTVKKSFDRL